jgi:PKD repeat protein
MFMGCFRTRVRNDWRSLVFNLCAAVLLTATGAARSDPIDCSTTPFGRGDRMVQDDEFLTLFSGSPVSGFDEYRLPFANEPIDPPLVQMYRRDVAANNGSFLTAVNVDLNGDGREEVAVAYASPDGNTGLFFLKIVVFERIDGFQPGQGLLNAWTYSLEHVNRDSVTLIAGDFSGTSDRRRELAVQWITWDGDNHGRQHVVLLTGKAFNNAPGANNTGADGRIVNADNTFAGEWRSTGTENVFGLVSIARGDFLLDGRDQLVAVSRQNAAQLNYDLLEFNDPTRGAHANSALPIASGNTAIGSRNFASDISQFADDAFVIGPFPGIGCQTVTCTEDITTDLGLSKIIASGGDLVDSAASELVVHVSFAGRANLIGQSVVRTQVGQFLGQRLVHFVTTQASAGGDITDVQLGASGAGRDFDFSQVLGSRATDGLPFTQSTAGAFDATIGAIDGQQKESVALVRVVNNQLQMDIYRAAVRLNAAFQFTVHAGTGPFPVDFTTTSTGDVENLSWDFGDGSSSIATNPSHAYSRTGTFTVTLTVADSANTTASYSTLVQINGQNTSGGVPAKYIYTMGTSAIYTAATADEHTTPSVGVNETINNEFSSDAAPHIAIGDMNRDGFAEIMTVAQSIRRDTTTSLGGQQVQFLATIWRSLWRLDPTQVVFQGFHSREITASGTLLDPLTAPYASAAVVAGDVDGDSTFATLGNDCRAISEPQLRELIWQPPFFSAMQSGTLESGFISASFGINEKSGSGTENRSGSFTGNSVSGYVGVQVGNGEDPISTALFKVVFQTSLKVTAGRDWQSAHGAIHGSDTEFDYSEGQSASVGEGLVVAEADNANCYSYNVVQSAGAVPNSNLRMCQITNQERTALTAETWNNQADYGGASPNWVPLQRDWASLALFRKPTSTIAFTDGKGPENATDGLFSSAAVSISVPQPYLDIDLGQVQGITSIRVFPAANTDAGGNVIAPLSFTRAALDLQGFRIYTSTTPFSGPGVPNGAGVRVFTQGTADDAVYDRWNIFTVDAALRPLSARYVRLQHPGTARINVSQVQVFADTHSDPPAFPDAVCDPTPNDGYFLARVWNAIDGGYQNIEARGDLMWSGTNARQQSTGVLLSNGHACLNHTDVRETVIWNNLRIGNTGITYSWDSTSDTTNTVGSFGSIESATRVGAEFDEEFGSTYVQEVAGVSYESTFGVTSDVQSTSFWGNGLQVGGEVGGFDPAFQNLVQTCGYFPHPYSYHVTDRGNSNYQHDLYVVDYIVHQPPNAGWQRGAVPLTCTGDDEIFADGFGN